MQILLGQHRFALASLHSKEKKTEIKKIQPSLSSPRPKKKPQTQWKGEGEIIVSTLHIPELLGAHYLTYLFTQSLSLMHFFLNTDTYSSTPE